MSTETKPSASLAATGEAETFPRLLAARAQRQPNAVALQEKRYGIWQPITWSEHYDRVRDFAHGLATLPVQRGEVVAVLGDNRPEWLIAELAAQAIGAAVVGIYPTSIGEEIVHILTMVRARVVITEDQEQVDKLIQLVPELPDLATVVYYDPHGLEDYTEKYLREFTTVEEDGRRWAADKPGWLDEQIHSGTADDLAVICTTSGTTKSPKLGELTHRNLLVMARQLMAVDPLDEKARFVSFLPLAWVGEQMLAVAASLCAGFVVSFPEQASTQRDDMRAIGPTVMFGPPRIWESIFSDVQVRLGEAGWLKRATYTWAHGVGQRAADLRVSGRRPGPWLRLLHLVADLVALRPVRDHIGLVRLDHAYTGGAPLGPDVFRFFQAIGVNLKQLYGQTEICGMAVVHRDDDIRFHTVGQALPETEIRISDSGEILLRSAAVFRGYHRQSEETAATVDADGWLHTGDAGYLDDGQLVVIDRAKDVRETPDGTRFSAAFVENKLKFSLFVEEAVVFGGETSPDVTALITIDMATVEAWAEDQHLGYTTYTDLAQKPGVYDLIARGVARANDDLPEAVRVRRFVLLHKQLDPDDGEITRTRKVRRGVIERDYAHIIEALLRGDERVSISATIIYQDGSRADRRIDLRIYDMSSFTQPAVPRQGFSFLRGHR